MGEELKKMDKAEQLADITFKLKKICNEKESYFAAQFKLTAMEFRCLKYLKDSEYLIVKDLAHNMNLTPSRVTRLITSLEQKKLIIRKLDMEDRRNVRVMINPKNKAFVDDMDKKHIALHEEILANVPAKKIDQTIDAVQGLYNEFEKWSEKYIKNSNIKNVKDF